jgi:hypothetical protein
MSPLLFPPLCSFPPILGTSAFLKQRIELILGLGFREGENKHRIESWENPLEVNRGFKEDGLQMWNAINDCQREYRPRRRWANKSK